MTEHGWYRASDGNWYFGDDPRSWAAPPQPDGAGGWTAAAPVPPPPPPAPRAGWVRRHKVLTGAGALGALLVAGSALGSGDDTLKRPLAATAAPTTPAAPGPVETTTEPAPDATTAPPTTAAPTPTPTPVPKPVPKPVRATTAAPIRTTAAAPALDPRFGTCKEAIANGYGPYYEGRDPEYWWYIDRDHDGVDCER